LAQFFLRVIIVFYPQKYYGDVLKIILKENSGLAVKTYGTAS